MKDLIARFFFTALIAASAGLLSAFPVTSVGDNLEAIGVSTVSNGERLVVLAGRRASANVFKPFFEVGLVSVPVAGGKGTFTNIPELNGSNGMDFHYAFSKTGELYFVKTAGTCAIRVGKVSSGRFVGVNIALPREFDSGDFGVKNIVALDDGGVDIAVNSMSKGALVTLKPDLSVKTIRRILTRDEFQGVLRLRGGAEHFAVFSSNGTDAWRGRVTMTIELRAPDLLATINRQQVKGLLSPPVQSTDGGRIAFSTHSVLPGLVTAHLYDASLTPIKSVVIVDKPSHLRPAEILLSDTRLVALHVDNGKCYATVLDSRDGRQLLLHDATAGPGLRCMNVTGVIFDAKLMLVTTHSMETAYAESAPLMIQILPL